MACKTTAAGFTLIELLVVVTIIVVLLALLTPALDKAIYQAELAMCAGSSQRSIANGSIAYAFDNRKFYPNARPDGSNGGPLWRQNSLIMQVGGTVNHMDPREGQNFDLRPYYYPRPGQSGASYVPSLKVFTDPVTDAIDVSYEANDPDCQIFSDYHVNAGWGPAGQGHMKKYGQGFRWIEPSTGAGGSFRILVSDKNEVHRDTRAAAGSNHPDSFGLLNFGSRQNAESPTQSPQSRATDLWPKKTISGFGGSEKRGLLSVNYGYDDGSVRRFDDVSTLDERFLGVPHENAGPQGNAELRRTMVPAS